MIASDNAQYETKNTITGSRHLSNKSFTGKPLADGATAGTHRPIGVERIIVDGPGAAAPLKTTRKIVTCELHRWRPRIPTACLPVVGQFLP